MMSTFPWTAAWLVLLLTATTTLAAETEEQQAEEQQQNLRREQEVTIEDPFWFQTELPEDYDYILPVGTANEILGGTRVSAGVYPYFVSLEYNGQIYCGATLISPNRVLSAAHCFFTRSGAIFLPTNIRVGHVSTTDGETVAPSCVKIHPQYGQDRQGLYSDVAVLKLATPVTTVTEFSQLNSFVGYPTDQAQGL
ncbi:protease serine 11B-like protein (Partial), partial [Seminavis robusta]|eukprot:Sro378_g130150.1 protease serine 11B-like protein (194) ;mRNA; r:2-685